MNPQNLAAPFLRVVGVLLLILATVHLVATPRIPDLLGSSPAAVRERRSSWVARNTTPHRCLSPAWDWLPSFPC